MLRLQKNILPIEMMDDNEQQKSTYSLITHATQTEMNHHQASHNTCVSYEQHTIHELWHYKNIVCQLYAYAMAVHTITLLAQV